MVSHRILLRGLGPLSVDGAPVLLERTDQELIPVLLDQLQAGGDLTGIEATLARQVSDAGVLRLFQPVQRTFYIALFEAVCELPGYPRVDPQAIESAGIVVRRFGANGNVQGWLSQQSTLRGWFELDAEASAADPDPHRRHGLTAGNVLIDHELARLKQITTPLAEAMTPLYVAPPAICAQLGKTVLYGMVPVTSSEFAEQSAAPVAGPDTTSSTYAQLVNDHLPLLLRAGNRPTVLPKGTFTEADGRSAASATPPNGDLRTFIDLLRQVAVELDAFGTSADALTLYAELNSIQVTLPTQARQGLGDFLKHATDVLVANEPGQVVFPSQWPTVSDAQAQRISQLVIGALSRKVVADEQGEQRFGKAGAFYQVRGFVRVDRDPACPPQLFWSIPSVRYQIAPWYENAGAGLPTPKIDLPDPFDRNALKKLKPNVSFRVPEKLFDLMQAMDPAKVMDGKKVDGGAKFGLDWICSFSIPIITICAFIVLNLFLSLFDLFFSWMLFIKICIPIPKRTA